ncbi:hypothetical protein KY326_04330, partial [Candidatus Woesearchaeota archaeon]|nr:hypothetical protein [Candidatus Woesearchaeota archaeon]
VWITNIYKCVLPEDREPKKAEYRRCISVLEEQIRSFRPRKILACGNRVFEHLFEGQNGSKFEQTVGKVFKYNDQIPTLVMHHPSKKWMYSREKREGDYEKLKEFLRAGTITLCGSAKFFPKLWDIKKELEMYGFEVLTPSMVDFHHLLHTNRERFLQRQRAATKDHFDKIRRSDAIYVANYDNDGIAGRVGENSFMEISVAFYRGIPIFMMKPVPDMAYGDIIECMSPNIVGENWDLMSDSLRDILLYVTGLTDLEVESSQDI